jgi:glycosyltransferase involved in cell wall biosynthesis
VFTPFDGFTLFPALMAASLTTWNHRAWPEDRRVGPTPPRVSVLIPARNEARNITAAVTAALAALPADGELIVYDDDSTDDTPRLLAAFTDPRLTVLQGVGLPPGWVGKPHACHRLALAARGDLLLFVDADVTLQPDALARLAAVLDDHDAAVLTAFPRQRAETWLEAVVLPFLPLSFVAWIPLDAVWRSDKPWLLAVSGQLLALRRATYDAIGGYEAVAADVVDDMAICRRAKQTGHRVVFAYAPRSATCRMYGSARELWDGFSKNLFEGLGESALALLAVVVLYLSAFVLPYLRVGWELAGSGVTWPAALGLLSTLWARALLAWRMGHRPLSVLLNPVGALIVLTMALRSAWWSWRGTVRWRGRVYDRRAARAQPEPPR